MPPDKEDDLQDKCTSTWQDLDQEAQKIASTTILQASDVSMRIQKAFSTLADGFKVAKDFDAKDSSLVKMGLLSQNLYSLKCSIDLAMRGYYTQSLNLLRGVYENWIAHHYVTQFPNQANLWMCATEEQNTPWHGKMLNSLGPEFPEHIADAKQLYGVLCRFSHPDALVVRPHLVDSQNGEISVFFGAPYYDPDRFRGCSYYISRLIGLMLKEISQWVPSDQAWQERCDAEIESVRQCIKQENDDAKKLKEMGKTNIDES